MSVDTGIEQQAIIDAIAARVHELYRRPGAANSPTLTQASIDAIAERAVTAAFEEPDPLTARVGPCYSVPGYARWIGVSRQAVLARIRNGQLIACQFQGGAWGLPAWQFRGDRNPAPELLTVWRILREGGDPWTCALWLSAATEATDGLSAARWIESGRPVEVLEELARADAARWKW